MKNVSFILQKKTKWTFWSTQYFISENQWGTSESNSFFREGRECSRDFTHKNEIVLTTKYYLYSGK